MALIDSTFGAALVGLIVSACLYGITLLQTFTYFRKYSNDKTIIKSLVVILTVLDTLHLALCTRSVYWYLVTNFGDASNLDVTTWSMALQVDCNGLIGVMVEVFFARRVWMMSRNWLITGIIVVLAFMHFSLGVVFTVESFVLGRFSKFASLTWETCLGLGSAAACDVIIAASMCYYLYTMRTGIKRTDSVVALLMVYSVNSGLTTGIIGTICVVTFAAMPTSLIWLSFFWIMGKCYVNSFLGLLNSRERLRDKVAAAVQLNHSGATHSPFPPSYNTSDYGYKYPRPPRMDGVAVSIETVTEYSPRSPRKSSNTERHDRMEVIQEVDMKAAGLRDDGYAWAYSSSSTPV
ncbi:hypothetical protein OH76DRAFT_1402729 [Lentinus brumalis]|uniref:DUF6534 domain-containing protein n=1 Tax=Lentinus brumalis TaxID=2498619 RepID=A0A371DCN3_9APHY|nr:hypothetical protein OH76DRAFT_1402729 [Polyporus brumalis]